MIATLASSVVAYAAWTGTASGHAQATTATSVNSLITPGRAGQSMALVPGGSVTQYININNPNPYPIYTYFISAASSQAFTNGGTILCPAGVVTSDARGSESTPSTPIQTADQWVNNIPAHRAAMYSITLHMASTAPDGCQGLDLQLDLNARLMQTAG